MTTIAQLNSCFCVVLVRDSELFLRHLDDLRRRLRCYRVIHVICDNPRHKQRQG